MSDRSGLSRPGVASIRAEQIYSQQVRLYPYGANISLSRFIECTLISTGFFFQLFIPFLIELTERCYG